MAVGLNRWTGFGNLAEDAKLSVIQSGTSVLKFTLACNESYKDKNEQRQERCEFVRCTMWGKRGESLAQYMKKGGKVYVEGGIRTTTSEKNGEKRYYTEINVTNVLLAGSGGGGSKASSAPEPQKSAPASSATEASEGDDETGDDIPF